MAVYKRNYRAYNGPVTPASSRWLVITRRSLAEVFASRITVLLFSLCLAPMLVCAVVIYVVNSDVARTLLNLRGPSVLAINNKFFLTLLEIQGWLAVFLTAWAGPLMISPDLTNGALPLFLSRPVSRAKYVLGKMLVLVLTLSAITWLPLLILFVIQAQTAPGAWFVPNLYIAAGIITGSFLWIALLAFVALATSAWVKWRIVATGLMVAILFIPAAFGQVINVVLGTRWGFVLNIPYLVTLVWTDLLRAPLPFRPLPASAAWITFAGICCLSLWLLHQRIVARQVVRG